MGGLVSRWVKMLKPTAVATEHGVRATAHTVGIGDFEQQARGDPFRPPGLKRGG